MAPPQARGAAVAGTWGEPQASAEPVQGRASWSQRYPPLTLALLVTIWLWRHPWEGIWHDNRLYAVQALHWLQPQVFGHDLFFLYGSQASFTLFTPCYAAAVSALGLYGATVALLACGYVAWIAAATFLLRYLLRGHYFWLGMVMLFALPSDYGPIPGVFGLAESFLTPRLFAEALSMLALAWVLRGRLRLAVLPALLACLLHPLIGLACAVSLFCHVGLSYRWRFAALLAIAVAAIVAPALSGVAPFDRLLQRMDDTWYALVADAAPVVVWDAWRGSEWISRTVLAFSLVLTGALLAEGVLRRMLYCVVLMGALGLAATWLGGGLFRNTLIVQLQPWRTLWLVQLWALCMLPWLAARYWPRGGLFRLLVLTLLLAYLARDSLGGALGVVAGCALWRLDRRTVSLSPTMLRAIAAAVLLITLSAWWATLEYRAVLWSAAMATQPQPTAQPLPYSYLYPIAWALFDTGGAVMALALFCMLSSEKWSGSRRRHLTAFGVMTAALLLAVAMFDRQQSSSTYRDPATVAEVQDRFLPLIGPKANVYWGDDVLTTWFVLGRASYASYTQLIGLVFSRGTAIEGYRRLERLRVLGMSDAVTGLDPLLRQQRFNRLPTPGFSGLVHACHDPLLDFVVLSKRFQDGVVQQASDRRNGQDFFLYDCALLRGRYADF